MIKGVNYNFKNFYLFATSACIFNYLPVSREFVFGTFCVWFIFERVWNLILKIRQHGKQAFVPYFKPMNLGKLRRSVTRRLQYCFFQVKILFIKIGFSPLVVLYTSVSRVIMFLMWMVVLLSSSTSLTRFKFGTLYTKRRALFWI